MVALRPRIFSALSFTQPVTTPPAASAVTNTAATTTTAGQAITTTTTQRSPAAVRELAAHAEGLGCAPSMDAIQHAELVQAQAHDPRVSEADMNRAIDRARRAQVLTPVSQHVLGGFTRVVDAKLMLTPSLVAALAASAGAADQLRDAIDKGPGDGAIVWPRPKNATELTASLIRQLVLGKGASMQLQLEPELAAFVEKIAAQDGANVNRAMGGAGAFAANLLSALPPVRPRFFSKEPLPQGIAERFSTRVEVIDGCGERASATKHATDTPARVNYSCEYGSGLSLNVLGRTHLKINGKDTPLVTSGSGRVILGSRAKDIVPGFDGVSDAALAKISKDTDTAFLVGTHYLTQGTPDEAKSKAQALATSLLTMKRENPRLVRHHQYVLPKQASNEGVVMTAVRGAWDSLSMNAVEVPALLHSLKESKLTTEGQHIGKNQGRDESEEPMAMLDGALAIKDGVDLKRVHLHGLLGDLIVVDDDGAAGEGVDVDRTRLALLRARQLASVKAANDSGEIKDKDDLFDVCPIVQGKCLAAVQRFADAIARRFSLTDEQRAHVVNDWHYRDEKTGEHIFFVPSRGIHDRSGGTVSLGDTIDASALVFARTTGRTKTHPRLQT